ncbi:MAG: hypothetical protein H0Z39_10015 [Peptococcaceae bacterium]|nr:hypothetical protein [Peptococcaceae bacterium]
MAKKHGVTDTLYNILALSAGAGALSTGFLLSPLTKDVPDLVPLATKVAYVGWGIPGAFFGSTLFWRFRRQIWSFIAKSLQGRNVKFPSLKQFAFWQRIQGGKGQSEQEKILLPGTPPLPPLDVLPLPPASETQHRTGFGYARRVDAAFRRCGLTGKGKIEVVSYRAGPVATRVTVTLPEGLRLSQLENAARDLQAAFGAPALQVTNGRRAGTANLILYHHKCDPVFLRPVLERTDEIAEGLRRPLPFILGVNDIGDPIMSDLVRVRHLLVAGATGAGKTWWLHQLLITLLLLRSPAELRLVLIDPKRVELDAYHHIPHTLTVATEVKEAVSLFGTLVEEMERRYEVMREAKVKNIQQYHRRHGTSDMPYVVVVIDELADLMVQAKKDVEPLIQRLTQLARAAGIHLIVATQRPSVDVITGVIKANLPSRVAFRLVSDPDYSTILDHKPQTPLRGKGDGIGVIEGHNGAIRFQSLAVGKDEDSIDRAVAKITDHWVGSGIKASPVPGFKNEAIQHDSKPAGSQEHSPGVTEAQPRRPEEASLQGPGQWTSEEDEGVIPGRTDLVDLPPLPEPDDGNNYTAGSLQPGNDLPSEAEDLYRLKLLIAQTGETRVQPLRKTLGIRTMRMQELMQQLVSEGWLESPPPNNRRLGYRLLLSEDDRRQFLTQACATSEDG